MRVGSYFAEIYADLILYGYALVAIYDRIQSITRYTKSNPQYSFWDVLDTICGLI